MDVRRLLGESRLVVALVLLIAARCVECVLYTYYCDCVIMWGSQETLLATGAANCQCC